MLGAAQQQQAAPVPPPVSAYGQMSGPLSAPVIRAPSAMQPYGQMPAPRTHIQSSATPMPAPAPNFYGATPSQAQPYSEHVPAVPPPKTAQPPPFLPAGMPDQQQVKFALAAGESRILMKAFLDYIRFSCKYYNSRPSSSRFCPRTTEKQSWSW